MNKRLHYLPILLLFLTVLPLPAAADLVPSIVVQNTNGDETHKLSLDDYNRINIGENGYTLISNNSNPDYTLSYDTHPRFTVKDVDAEDITTKTEETIADAMELVMSYDRAKQSICINSETTTLVRVYNLSGLQVLVGYAGCSSDFSVASLTSGIYLAQADVNGSVCTIKFIKY